MWRTPGLTRSGQPSMRSWHIPALPVLALALAQPASAAQSAGADQPTPAPVEQASESQPLAPGPLASEPAADAPPASGNADGNLGFLSARALEQRCLDPSPGSAAYCFAYIAAVHDAMRSYEVWLQEEEFCAPADIAQGDLRRAFLTYVSAYPENRAGQAASVVVVSIKQTYPCL